MNVGSLFSGIGGFDLGLERAGMRVVWQCEQDEFCRRVLAGHWPGVPCYPDVRALVGHTQGEVQHQERESDATARRRRREQPSGTGADGSGGLLPVPVPSVDVLCGGFPCQDISLAGKGAGIDGERSGLWSEYARLVGELRPRYVIVENVSALLSRGLGRVVGDLAALGYDAEWDCLPASAFGAPHQRDRLWLVAYPHADRGRLEIGTELDGEPQADTTDGDSRRRHADRLRDEVADADSERGNGTGQLPEATGRTEPSFSGASDVGHAWAAEPDVGRMADGVPARVDRLRGLGNALVPQIAQWLGERILEREAMTLCDPPRVPNSQTGPQE